MIGSTISHYKILEKLGEGGMGVVYRAEDTRLKRTVALKFLPPELTRDPEAKERFIHEAQAASVLQHSNICTIHDIDETEDGQLFIVMDCYEAETLRNRIAKGQLRVEEVADLATQVAQGLDEAHQHGIVHRDIKPANILITKSGQVKIVDFGLAKLSGATKLTRTGSTLGTIAYMSPEQLQGSVGDHRSDIFSFGVVLYEMLTGKPPFRGDHEAALMYSIVNDEPLTIQQYLPDVSAEIVRVIGKALEKDPEARYQTLHDMITDLQRLKKEKISGIAVSEIRSRWVLKSLTSKKVLWVGVPAVVAIATLVIVLNPFGSLSWNEEETSASTNTLAVMYFENIPDPEDKEHTAEMLTSLMTTSLSQTQGLEVISRERLFDIQAELGAQETKKITAPMTSKIAQRVGAAKVLTGSIVQLQPQMAITAQLVEVKSGKILGAQRLIGFERAQIFTLVDSLTLLVRKDLNILSGLGMATKSVATMTSVSQEAYRAYVEGVELRKRFSNAKPALNRAIELDTNFTMAYYELSKTGDENALRKAWHLRENVTEPQRLEIEASYHFWIEQDVDKSVRTIESLVQKYPHYQGAYFHLMGGYFELLEYEKAIQSAQRGLRNDSLDKSLANTLGYIHAFLNQKKEALEMSDRYLRLAPGESNPYDSRGEIFFIFGEVDSALHWFRKSNSLRPSWSANSLAHMSLLRQDYESAGTYFHRLKTGVPDDQAESDIASAMILMHQGKLIAARRELARILSSHETTGAGLARDRLYLMNISYELGDYKAMVQYARNLPRVALARAWLKNGNESRCETLMVQTREDLKGKSPWRQITYDYTEAILSFEKGNYESSLRQFRKAFEFQPPNRRPDYFYGVVLAKLGHTSEAIRELEGVTWWVPMPGGSLPVFDTRSYWIIAAVKAHYWLGVAHEKRRENQKAIKQYKKFLDLWKNADFESAELRDAKARLAKLTGRT